MYLDIANFGCLRHHCWIVCREKTKHRHINTVVPCVRVYIRMSWAYMCTKIRHAYFCGKWNIYNTRNIRL